jgi:hypothetical protein
MASGLQGARLLGPNGQPISSGNKVSENGAKSSTTPEVDPTTSGNNKVSSNGTEAAKGGGGGNAFAQTAAAFGGFFGGANLVASAMPGAATAVRQDLLTNQSAFYGQGGFGGGLQQQTSAVRAMQNALAKRGIATNSMDTTNALAMAQSLGLSGATNFNQVMQGAAVASTFAPGLGVAGATQAMGTLNAPSTVNMLRTVGISIRGMDGAVKPLPQIADELWRFITQGGTVGLSERDVQISLMPGNGLYGMLTSLVGQDPTTFTLLSNMLIAKAKTGGKTALANMSKGQLQQMGLTTATVNKMAGQTAAQTNLLTTTASATAAGYGLSADIGSALNNFAAAAGPLTQALGAFSGAYTGTMGLGNGALGSLVKTITSLFSLKFLAGGGPAEGNMPYVVGEKGPELFVPKTDGTVVSNSDMKGMFREKTGGVSSYGYSGGKKSLSDDQLKNVLSAAGFKGSSLETAFAVARAESGGRPGALNPTAATGDYSMGLFQINMIGDLGTKRNAEYLKKYGAMGYKGPQSLYDPTINAAIAYDISKGGSDFTKAWVNTSKKLGLAGSPGGSGSSGGANITSSLSSSASTISYSDKIQGLIAAASGAMGMSAGSSNTYNNGPLTININGAGDPKKVAAEVQKVLASNNLILQTGAK